MSTSMQDRIEAERQRALAALSAPLHQFKQPDGSRYPSTRPDGLVYQKQLRELLGIAETTLLRWQRLGWIAPEGKAGHCTLYRVPSPERLAEIRQLAKQRLAEGADRGRQTQIAEGANIDRAAKGRAIKTEQAQERQAQGLLNKRQLAKALGTHCGTLNRWIEEGVIAPALVSESGKWVWFKYPDTATLERIWRSAKGRTKASLGIEIAAKSEPAPRQAIKRGTCPVGTISFTEAAERTGVPVATLEHWTEKGWLPFVKESRYVRGIVPEVLDAYLVERAAQKEKNAGRLQSSEGLLSTVEVCKFLGTTECTLRRWMTRGWIAPVGTAAYGALRFETPTPEQIAIIRANVHEARSAAGRANARHIVTGEAIAKREASRAANRLASRPEGCLMRKEAAEVLGLNTPTFNKHVQKGWIVEVDGWIRQDDLDQYKAKLNKQKALTPTSPPKNVVDVPKTATVKPFAPKPAKKVMCAAPAPPVVPVGFVLYDQAIADGRKDARFQTVLGFNLLSHPSLGFRAAVVNEKPENGWRYHERHSINGFGQWQIRSQKPSTGEILL